MKRLDLTNQMFGDWKALEYAGDRKWLCECQCPLHTRREVSTQSLLSGRSTGCGHSKIKYDLTGMRFGELKVIEYTGDDNMWKCECSCGKIVNKSSKHLRYGNVNVCDGSHKRNMMIKQGLIEPKVKDDKPKKSRFPREYGDWTAIDKVDDGIYLCECVCGYRKNLSDSALWNAKKNDYKCRHVKILHRRFGYLEVLERKTQKQTVCKCHACGKVVTINLGNILNGSNLSCGCVGNIPKYTKEEILEVIKKYTLEHDGLRPQPLELKDLLGLSETATYENIERYDLKPYLELHASKGEKEVLNIFEGLNIIRHDRKILGGLELDIYLPDFNLAVEYNGSYWHSDTKKDKKYHQNKTIACAKKGIHLVHVFEHEWMDTRKRVKITNYLKGLVSEGDVCYARKLEVREISSQEANDFMYEYHLQDGVNSKVNIALMNNTEIISVMTLSRPRFDNKYEYEITRYCTKNNIRVVGGAEKLFKYFVDRYKPSSVITYVDISKFTGNVYPRLGFKFVEDNFITQPNYVWVDSNFDVKPRYQTQKQKLIEDGLGTQDQTESEIMEGLGYYRVYDSGNLKLQWIERR